MPVPFDRAQVNYRFSRQRDRCSTCRYYLPGEGQVGSCLLVAGAIRADALCDLYEARDIPETGDEAADDLAGPVAMSVKGEFDVAKSDDEQQNLFGWAYVAVDKSGDQVVDHSGESIDVDELEKAAYDFVIRSRTSGEGHSGDVNGVLIEAMAFTDEKFEALAKDAGGDVDQDALDALRKALPLGFWVGFHVPDREAFERAKKDRGAFSIEGSAKRVAA